MATATDEELMKMGQDDLKRVVDNWGAIDVTFKDEDSYWDGGKACVATECRVTCYACCANYPEELLSEMRSHLEAP